MTDTGHDGVLEVHGRIVIPQAGVLAETGFGR